jgi:septal ring factor EnvC (AmiA/AmiB activator)
MRVRRPERVALLCAGLCLAGAALAPGTHAETANDKPRAAGPVAAPRAIQRDSLARTAAALGEELGGLRRQSITIAEAMQQHEAALSLIESRLEALAAAQQRTAADLTRHEKDRSALLMALVQLARNPPEALAFSSSDPVDVERSALLIGRALPPLDRAARRLRDDLLQLAALRQAIAQAEDRHRQEQKSLDVQQFRLADVISRKAALRHRNGGDAADPGPRLALLASEATSLRDLINRLDAAERNAPPAPPAATSSEIASLVVPEKPTAPETVSPTQRIAAPALTMRDLPSFDAARGQVLVPASGALVERFGKSDDVGMVSKGVSYETRSGAQVVAPFDGRVLFAGPFRAYGQILIIEHSDGYHSLLAGLAQLDVAVGQWLVAGEPVGTMPMDEDKPRLYLELRHDGQPINPSPWLAAPNEKVSG